MEEAIKENSVNSFDIKFKDNKNAYYAGDTIDGSVDLNLRSQIELHGIRIQFRGESFVCWQNQKVQGIYENVSSHKSFWNQTFTAWGSSMHEETSAALPSGHHTFHFSVQIPVNNIPSSFENKYGTIRYWAKAYIDRSFCEESRVKPFTVLQSIDINAKKYQSKVSNDAEKTTCCFCFKPSSLSLAASLDRSGYCPGESIAVNCRARNRARRDMGGIKARLIQKVIYHADKHYKMQETILSAIGGNKIERGRTKVWENQMLKIPAVPPSIDIASNLAVFYKVQITMVVPNGVDLQFQLPITIGTIPLSPVTELKKNVKLKKCTDGTCCFNHASETYNFPLQAFIPSTSFVDNYIFMPKRSSFTEDMIPRSTSKERKRKDGDEKQPLLCPRNTYTP